MLLGGRCFGLERAFSGALAGNSCSVVFRLGYTLYNSRRVGSKTGLEELFGLITSPQESFGLVTSPRHGIIVSTKDMGLYKASLYYLNLSVK